MAERIDTITHKGKTILLSDFSGLMRDELLATMRTAMERDKGMPNGSRLLSDVTDCKFNEDVRKLAIEMGKFAEARQFKQAIVGITGIQKILFQALNRNVRLFSSRGEAMDWLVS